MPRGGGRGGRPMGREEQISRALSKILRHRAEAEGLTLGPAGYVNLADLLNTRTLRSLKITLAEVQAVVSSNDKQRFSLIPVSAAPESSEEPGPISATNGESEDTDPKNYLIRANQGHSIKVEGHLTQLDPASTNLPDTVVHGTTRSAWTLIVTSGGLKPMGRTHVHFATGLPDGFKSLEDRSDLSNKGTPQPVISGMRNSSTVLVFLDLAKAMEQGIKFFTSDNGVVLTEGDENGLVPISVFKRVEERGGQSGFLVKDGVVVGEVKGQDRDRGGGRGRRGGQRGGGSRNDRPQLVVESDGL